MFPIRRDGYWVGVWDKEGIVLSNLDCAHQDTSSDVDHTDVSGPSIAHIGDFSIRSDRHPDGAIHTNGNLLHDSICGRVEYRYAVAARIGHKGKHWISSAPAARSRKETEGESDVAVLATLGISATNLKTKTTL